MSDIEIGLYGLGLLFVLISLRIPIGIAMIGVSFGGLYLLGGWRIAWASLGLLPFNFAASWVLSAVPMFLLLGFLCYHAKLTEGLFRAARVWLQGMPGGLAIASVLGSAGFAAVSGSSIACSATMGRIAVPEMTRAGYHPELATGTVAVAGTIGALIPPSVIMLIFAVIAKVPVTDLFVSGIAAGLVTALGYILVILIRVKLNPSLAPRDDNPLPIRERFLMTKDTWPILLIMLGVFTGLFSGVFTATEAGAIGAFLATLVAMLKRTLTWSVILAAISDTVLTTSTMIIIGVGATVLTRFLAFSGAGDFLSDLVVQSTSNPVIIMLGLVVLYLFLGLFLEPVGAMLLTLPLVLPIIRETGFDMIWFGIILTKLLEIGMITPPVGMNVFVIKGVVGSLVTTGQIFRGIGWFLVMDLLVLGLLIALPQIVLFPLTLFGN
ncbi:TRAP transporter large permease [Pseudophaeobacter sp.]|jgi:tripartite ATP-independent transporter DctM subunit|uniref:TRAP transporter large permease n=1 Tax=Pseudophaeobacter sp. TaxID=1971739 RepID=UPI0026062601|nr:TRAP transporter large permease [Pseudophaeobacter sp.]